MRCKFYSYCSEPRYLCCNFYSNKSCDVRCRDDHSKCKYYEPSDIIVDDSISHHMILSNKQINSLYEIRNDKENLSLYKRFGKYIAIKDGDKIPSNSILVITSKNKAQKKLDELIKENNNWKIRVYKG